MNKPLNYEAHLEALTAIIKSLEMGQTPLNESLKLFEEGIFHYRNCSEQLEAAQTKVKLLMNDTLVDFKPVEE